MAKPLLVLFLGIGLMLTAGCSRGDDRPTGGSSTSDASRPVRIAFLHHSTGQVVWAGAPSEAAGKVPGTSDVAGWIPGYDRTKSAVLEMTSIDFPTGKDYEWANYPYDYYNIWVKHAGDAPYLGEPTLEMLTAQYDVIVWKHCFPVGNILPDTGTAEVDSAEKRIENYKLQYARLKEKMRSFPDTEFIVWTGAALLGSATSPQEAQRTRQFFDWVRSQWDEPGDNIFLWDFYRLETEGGPYLKAEYAAGPTDSHPSPDFGRRVAPLFARRVADVVEGNGDSTSLTGGTE